MAEKKKLRMNYLSEVWQQMLTQATNLHQQMINQPDTVIHWF